MSVLRGTFSYLLYSELHFRGDFCRSSPSIEQRTWQRSKAQPKELWGWGLWAGRVPKAGFPLATRLPLTVAHAELALSDLAQPSTQPWMRVCRRDAAPSNTVCFYSIRSCFSCHTLMCFVFFGSIHACFSCHTLVAVPFSGGAWGDATVKIGVFIPLSFFSPLCFFRIASPQDLYSVVTPGPYSLSYRLLLL